jgi:DNA mismatch endonuclease (patch repair protein)
MLANRGRDTEAELAVRRLVHRAGLRYRVNARPVPTLRRTADLVFPGPRIAVFIDGCFWHGCPEHATWPKANEEFWRAKIEGNRARDEDTTARLRAAGWLVLRYWTHEAPSEIAADIVEQVRRRRGPGKSGAVGRSRCD